MGKKRLLALITFLALLGASAAAGATIAGYAEEYVYTNPGCIPFCFGNNKTYDLGGTFQVFEATKVGGHQNHEAEWFDGGLALFVGNTQTTSWYFLGAANRPLQTFYHDFNGSYADRVVACGCSYDYHQSTHPFSIEYNRNFFVRRTSVLDDPDEPLGEAGSFFTKFSNLTNDSGWRIRVNAASPNSMVWLGDEESYTTHETSDLTAKVYGCADTNKNQICDVREPSFMLCNDVGGDWYDDLCCGTNYTEGYVKSEPINITQICVQSTYAGSCTRYADVVHNKSINAICGKTAEGKWKWAPLDEVGEVFDLLGWPNASVVSDGTNLYSCGNQIENYSVPSDVYSVCLKTERQRTAKGYEDVCVKYQYLWRHTQIINSPATTLFGQFISVAVGSATHMYSCKDKVVYECSGKTGPFSTNNGAEMGATNPSFTNETFYCASDADWTSDLDIKDDESCEAAGFSWTGSRCCSEADDTSEYYNDPKFPNATGGCWNKMFVRAGEFAVTDRILNYKGKFFGCRLSLINDAILLNIKDYHLDNLLIDNSITPCGMVLMDAQPGGMPHAKCQPNGEWMFTDEPGGVINKSIKWAGLVSSGIALSGCCAPDQCWNGTKCQRLGTYYRIGEEGFICKMLPPTSTPEPPTSEICHHNNDCSTGQYCTDQECISGSLPDTCANNNACPSGYHCQQHECVEE